MDPKLMALLGAGFSMGVGALCAGIGLGNAVGKAFEAIGRNPESQKVMGGFFFIGLAFIEAIGIYAFVVSLLLLLLKG